MGIVTLINFACDEPYLQDYNVYPFLCFEH